MRILQTLVKALAILLAVTIVGGMIAAVAGALPVLGWITGDGDTATGAWTHSGYQEEIMDLDVNVKATKMEFRKAKDDETVRVETNNNYVESWIDGGTLHVVEKSHGVFGFGGTGNVVIYVKDGHEFNNVELEVGAGEIMIDKLMAKELTLELGAGKVKVDELGVSRRAKISNGAGKLELGLIGEEKDYQIIIDKGLGSVKLNGVELEDDARVGNGAAEIDIDSGVGAVEIKTTGK